MPSRHLSRRRALQVLFQCDVRKVLPADAIGDFYLTLYTEEGEERPEYDAFMEQLAVGAHSVAEEIDATLARHSEHWKVERMSSVDRNVLRLAVFEMKYLATPPAIVIDEAIELARRFSGDDSARFVNGVLDAFRKTLEPQALGQA